MDDAKLIKYYLNNPKVIEKSKFLLDNVEHEDYILLFYANYLSTKDVDLTRKSLEVLMASHMTTWLEKGSIYTKKYASNVEMGELVLQTVPMDYIQQKSPTGVLFNEVNDYARELYNIVLKRYDEIMKEAEVDEDEAISLLEAMKVAAQDRYTRDIIDNILPILTGASSTVVLGRNRYDRTTLLEFIRDISNDCLDLMNTTKIMKSSLDCSNKLLDDISKDTGSGEPVWHWNIGKKIFKNVLRGWLITLSAPAKVGKTKFVIGEMVYPTLCEGNNVKYYSGEISKAEVLANLCVKHIYATQGLKVNLELATDTIIYTQKIKKKTFKVQAELDNAIKLLDSYDKVSRELVLVALSELLFSGKFGTLEILHLGAVGAEDGLEDSDSFIVEDFKSQNLKEMKERPEELRADLIVIDHVNHFSSRTGMSLNEKIERMTQDSKSLASNTIYPCTVVVVNHVNTKETKEVRQASKVEDLKDKTFDSYGSASDRKDADISLSLISTPDQDRDGLITLIVNDDRRVNHLQIYKTKSFVMIADKAINDFCLINEIKKAYITKEDILNGILN